MKSPDAPTNKKGQEIRDRIVSAANTLFYQRGFNLTSFSEVAEASGIPKGNFYYYFKSKDELLTAVIEARKERIMSMLKDWEKQYPNPKQRLKRYVQILLNEANDITRYGCPMGTLNMELAKTQPELKSEAVEMMAIFEKWLRSQFAAMGKNAKEAKALALHLLSATQGAALVGNVFEDLPFIKSEVAKIKQWIDEI